MFYNIDDSLLDDAVKQLNARPLAKLNGLSPSDFNTVFDDVKLQEPNMACDGQVNQVNPSSSTMVSNEKDFQMSQNKYKVDSFVYVTQKKKHIFSKSFEAKVKVQKAIGAF